MSPESPILPTLPLSASSVVSSEQQSASSVSSGSDQQSIDNVTTGSFDEITNRSHNLNATATDTNAPQQQHHRSQHEYDDDASDNESTVETTQATKKIKWTELEDSRLRAAVSTFITGPVGTDVPLSKALASSSTRQVVNWGDVASRVPNRTAKQCRERWCYNLDPCINHGPFTLFEDAILLKAHRTLGNQWAAIAKLLPSRTENAVKTRHKSVMRAQKREWKPYEDQLLVRLYDQFGGGRWNEFVGHFDKRTANALKTRFAYLKNNSLNKVVSKTYSVTPNTSLNFSLNKENEKERVSEGNVRQVWLNPNLIETVDLNYYIKKNNNNNNNNNNSNNNSLEKAENSVKESCESQSEDTEVETENEVTVIENVNNKNIVSQSEPQKNMAVQNNMNNITNTMNNNNNNNSNNIFRNIPVFNNTNNSNFHNLNALSNLATFQTYPNFKQVQSFNTPFQTYPNFQHVPNFATSQTLNKNAVFDENCNKVLTGVSLFQEAVLNDNCLSAQEKLKFSERSYSLSIDFFEAKKRKLQNNNNNNNQ